MQNITTVNNPDKVRIKKACNHLDVSESFLRHAIMNKKIPAYKLFGAVYVSLSEIESMIANNKI